MEDTTAQTHYDRIGRWDDPERLGWASEPAHPTPAIKDVYGNVRSNPMPGLARIEKYMIHSIGAAQASLPPHKQSSAEEIAKKAWSIAMNLVRYAPGT